MVTTTMVVMVVRWVEGGLPRSDSDGNSGGDTDDADKMSTARGSGIRTTTTTTIATNYRRAFVVVGVMRGLATAAAAAVVAKRGQEGMIERCPRF